MPTFTIFLGNKNKVDWNLLVDLQVICNKPVRVSVFFVLILSYPCWIRLLKWRKFEEYAKTLSWIPKINSCAENAFRAPSFLFLNVHKYHKASILYSFVKKWGPRKNHCRSWQSIICPTYLVILGGHTSCFSLRVVFCCVVDGWPV